MKGLTKEIKAIDTEFDNYKFRSRLEARWAIFFALMHIEYEYEPEGLQLSYGKKYLPDFYLPQFYSYFEVKRKSISEIEKSEAIRKISDGMKNDKFSGIICFGDPVDNDIRIWCQEKYDPIQEKYGPIIDDGAKVTFGMHPDLGYPILFTDEYFGLAFYDSSEKGNQIPMFNPGMGKFFREENVVNWLVEEMRKISRQARFEHGEKPIEIV